ncbi:MAG: hypothetical protein QOD84_3225 [Acidobacteriaceae bacterium]|jgi:ubiquinone/menaquinone biosynthesis C-methylase UbiE
MTDINLEAFNNPEVADHYSRIDYITPCEKLVCEKYVAPGGEVLDLGVGGGRTTSFLTSRAGAYVGLDYAPTMVEICRLKFPSLKFFEGDAADLSRFADGSFQTIVMAFNGIDTLSERSRQSCLRECSRVLRRNGMLIFSSHNPRAVLIIPKWNQQRVQEYVRRAIGNYGSAMPIALAVFTAAAAMRAYLRGAWISLRRTSRRLFTPLFVAR